MPHLRRIAVTTTTIGAVASAPAAHGDDLTTALRYAREPGPSVDSGNTRAFAPSPGIAINPTVHSTMEDVMRQSICNETLAFDVLNSARRSIRSAPRFAARMAVVMVALAMAACGGGSSSSGGGIHFAGDYNGIATITLSAPGLPPETLSGPIRIVVDRRGNVTSDPGTSAPGAGKLNGNSFTATVPGERFNEPGFTCNGSILIKGTLSGDSVTGTISENALTCNGIPIQVNGTYSATRAVAGAVSRAPAGRPAMETLRESFRTAR